MGSGPELAFWLWRGPYSRLCLCFPSLSLSQLLNKWLPGGYGHRQWGYLSVGPPSPQATLLVTPLCLPRLILSNSVL